MVRLRRIRERLSAELSLHGTDERSVALGFAAGVFVGCTPLLSLHTPIALFLALLLRCSKAAAILGAWANTPLSLPFVYYGSLRLGEFLLGGRSPDASVEAFMESARSLDSAGAWAAVRPLAAPLFLGTTLVGLAAALLAYSVVYRLAVKVKSAHHKAGQ